MHVKLRVFHLKDADICKEIMVTEFSEAYWYFKFDSLFNKG